MAESETPLPSQQYCPGCDRICADDWSFCPSCGTDLSEPRTCDNPDCDEPVSDPDPGADYEWCSAECFEEAHLEKDVGFRTDGGTCERDNHRHVINRGFARIEANISDGRIVITKRKRKHTFGKGYEAVGPSRELYEGPVQEAVFVGDILAEIFHSEADETDALSTTDNDRSEGSQ